MTPAATLDGTSIRLRPVTAEDVTDAYCAWLNDPAVNQYLETRFVTHTRASVAAYVEAQRLATDAVLLAIVRRHDDRHVGNIRIGGIDRHHRSATIALMIGDRTAWGHGIGTEAIALASRYAGEQLGVRKLNARCYAGNIGSIRAFEKAGWTHEGRQAAQFVSGDGVVDGIWLGFMCERATPP